VIKNIYIGSKCGVNCHSFSKEISTFHMARAHAHLNKYDYGNLCFKTGFFDKETILHEIAHLLSNEGHTDNFRKMLAAIGGKVSLEEFSDGNCSKSEPVIRYRNWLKQLYKELMDELIVVEWTLGRIL
jgi:hypothetical protein